MEEMNSENYQIICKLFDDCNLLYGNKKMSAIIKEYYEKITNANDNDLLQFIASHSKKKNIDTVKNIVFTYGTRIGEISNYECINTGAKYTPVLSGGTKTPFDRNDVDIPKRYGITKYSMYIQMVMCSY